MAQDIIKLENVTKFFGNVKVIQDLTVGFQPGQVTCIIGPSGSGKSTLLRMLNLLEYPTSGQMIYQGKPFNVRGANLQTLRAEVTMVFQSFNLFPHMDVLANCVIKIPCFEISPTSVINPISVYKFKDPPVIFKVPIAPTMLRGTDNKIIKGSIKLSN